MYDSVFRITMNVFFGFFFLRYCFIKNKIQRSNSENDPFHTLLFFAVSGCFLSVFNFSLVQNNLNGIALITIWTLDFLKFDKGHSYSKVQISESISLSTKYCLSASIAIVATIANQAHFAFNLNADQIQPDIFLPWTTPIQPIYVPYFILAAISLLLWILKRGLLRQNISPIRMLQAVLIFPFPILGPKVIVDQTFECLASVRIRTKMNLGIGTTCLFLIFFVKTRISLHPPTETMMKPESSATDRTTKAELLQQIGNNLNEGRNFEALVTLIQKLESDAKKGLLDDQVFQMAFTLSESQRRPDLRRRIENTRFKIKQEPWVYR